jgi:hypothetical protein
LEQTPSKKKKRETVKKELSDSDTKEAPEKKKRSIKEKRAKILLGRVQFVVRMAYIVHFTSLLVIPISLIYALRPHPRTLFLKN